jgi:hypothetical protein
LPEWLLDFRAFRSLLVVTLAQGWLGAQKKKKQEMATKRDAGEANMAPSLQSAEISDLLKAILDELKSIRCEFKRQDEQIRLVSQSVPISQGHLGEERQNPVG